MTAAMALLLQCIVPTEWLPINVRKLSKHCMAKVAELPCFIRYTLHISPEFSVQYRGHLMFALSQWEVMLQFNMRVAIQRSFQALSGITRETICDKSQHFVHVLTKSKLILIWSWSNSRYFLFCEPSTTWFQLFHTNIVTQMNTMC